MLTQINQGFADLKISFLSFAEIIEIIGEIIIILLEKKQPQYIIRF